jgi:hypothetical protein
MPGKAYQQIGADYGDIVYNRISITQAETITTAEFLKANPRWQTVSEDVFILVKLVKNRKMLYYMWGPSDVAVVKKHNSTVPISKTPTQPMGVPIIPEPAKSVEVPKKFKERCPLCGGEGEPSFSGFSCYDGDLKCDNHVKRQT